jgi:hypothetical protein
MAEDPFVRIALSAISASLSTPLSVEQGAPLLYEVRVDNNLKITVDPRSPTRGQSAFETDLCVFEHKSDEVRIPRVVLEFKASVTTHDIITYSSKARRHKFIYPYLRYGLVASKVKSVPRKYFVHNEGLDFMLAVGGLTKKLGKAELLQLVSTEVAASRTLESLVFGARTTHLVRNAIE